MWFVPFWSSHTLGNQFPASKTSPFLAPSSFPSHELTRVFSSLSFLPHLVCSTLCSQHQLPTGCFLLLKLLRSPVISVLVSLPNCFCLSLSSHNPHSAASSATASEGRSDFSCQFSTFPLLSRLDLVMCFKVGNDTVRVTCYWARDETRGTGRAAKILNNKLERAPQQAQGNPHCWKQHPALPGGQSGQKGDWMWNQTQNPEVDLVWWLFLLVVISAWPEVGNYHCTEKWIFHIFLIGNLF